MSSVLQRTRLITLDLPHLISLNPVSTTHNLHLGIDVGPGHEQKGHSLQVSLDGRNVQRRVAKCVACVDSNLLWTSSSRRHRGNMQPAPHLVLLCVGHTLRDRDQGLEVGWEGGRGEG